MWSFSFQLPFVSSCVCFFSRCLTPASVGRSERPACGLYRAWISLLPHPYRQGGSAGCLGKVQRARNPLTRFSSWRGRKGKDDKFVHQMTPAIFTRSDI